MQPGAAWPVSAARIRSETFLNWLEGECVECRAPPLFQFAPKMVSTGRDTSPNVRAGEGASVTAFGTEYPAAATALAIAGIYLFGVELDNRFF